MKNTRIICLCLALATLIALVGCNSEIPEETTETVADTEAPAIETDPIETEPIASGTAPQPENPKKGCGSAVIPSAAVVALTVGAVACAKKKKKDD